MVGCFRDGFAASPASVAETYRKLLARDWPSPCPHQERLQAPPLSQVLVTLVRGDGGRPLGKPVRGSQ